jgi:hypothetical protein
VFQRYIRWREEQLAKEDDANKLVTPLEWGTDVLLGEQPGN